MVGSVLVTATLAALVAATSAGEQAGFAAPTTIALFLAAGGLGLAFVVVQFRSPHPMLPHALLANRTRIGALLVTTLEFAIVVGYVYFISLYLQNALGFSPILAGISVVPATVVVMLTSMLVSPRLLSRLGVRTQLGLGLVFMALGQGLLILLGPTSSYTLLVLPGLLLTTFGMGLSIPAAAVAANAHVPAALRGTAGGLLVTTQQAGSAIGLAVLAAIAARTTNRTHSLTAGFDRAYLVAAGLALVAALMTLVIMPTQRRNRNHARAA